ncbi:hypothetical protein B7C51_03110 [Paenibacillus larvae subsp. pulvifaciens]|uniref:Fibronectin type-III domain-containing protein n=1 Tax=Paenibacillus larvae subsp. pulvifaciens TaxID=1477 RepID=A0A1V0UPF3_9BACL|nr:fibronectin type III domain-containing protein [Paenibacillus larvae]ARF67011.1 hypothetical protein B7C51_03110 [Paenibacillus larvae subsp. pulvifaciens]
MDKTLKTQDECTKIIVKFKDQVLQSTPLVLEEENILTQGDNDFFSDFSGLEFNRLIFTVSPEDMIQDLKTYNLPKDLSLFHYYSVEVSKDQGDPQSIVDKLKQSSLVETAYIELPCVEHDIPHSVSAIEDRTKHGDVYAQPDRNPLFRKQDYLKAAPYGIDSQYAWSIPGGEGEGILFVDMEYTWLLDHEDLVDQQIGLVPGSVDSYPGDGAHGTAVLGIVVGTDNTVGIIGASPKAQAKGTSYPRENGKNNIADAIMSAALVMKPGDVLLTELGGDAGPLEGEQANFDAIKYATDKGITVVSTGGNNGLNLDTHKNKDGKNVFNRNSPDFKDSGAILVGAASSDLSHTRLSFSNYGNRIDVYAWGENVTTAYANLENMNIKNLYTDRFNGTSSAGAIIAGAAVNLQGIAKANLGRPFTPTEVRELLSDPNTGTPSNNPSFDQIGVMPDLKLIVNKLGIGSNLPGAPTGLQATDIETNSVTLKWNPSEINVGIQEYLIYRNDTLVGEGSSSTEFKDRGLLSNTEYRYTVKAVDVNGNVSLASKELKVKTLTDWGILYLEVTDIQTNSVTLKWSPSDNVSENNDAWYFIYVNGISQFGTKETEWTFNDLQASTKYRFRVQVKSEDENVLDISNEREVKTLADQTIVLEATDIQSNSVSLKWSPVSESADLWYYVYRNDRNGHVGGTTTPDFVDTFRLEANTEYRYRVQAVIDGKMDDPIAISNELKVKTLGDQTLVLEATDIQTDRVTLQWSPYDFDENQEPKYNVYCDGTIRKGAFEPVTTIERLQPNTEYTFKVSAAGDNWEDLQFSNEIKVRTK